VWRSLASASGLGPESRRFKSCHPDFFNGEKRRQQLSFLDPPRNGGYTNGMKTAVSIPNDIYAEIERLARHLNKSRSELYSLALAEYAARHAPDHLTEAMDRVCAEVGAETDVFSATAARRILERSPW
jgi:hypothetical protein